MKRKEIEGREGKKDCQEVLLVKKWWEGLRN